MAERTAVVPGVRRPAGGAARLAATARLVLLLAFEVGAIVVLHRLGAGAGSGPAWDHLSGWLARTPPEDAAWAVVRLVGLACAYWQLASTLVYLGARLSRLPAAVAGVRWACLPGVRRLVDGALAVSMVGSAVLSGPARATTPTTSPPVVVQVVAPASPAQAPAYQPVAAGDAGPATPTSTTATSRPPTTTTTPASSTSTSTTTSTPPPSPGTPLPPSAPQGRPSALRPAPERHEVVAGDNLWAIAESHLAEATGRSPESLTEAEVAAYWLALMEANEGRLRSGNPNLIFPGEIVICPTVSDAER